MSVERCVSLYDTSYEMKPENMWENYIMTDHLSMNILMDIDLILPLIFCSFV